MNKYPTNYQLRVCELTLLAHLTDRQAARRMRKSPAAIKQARYRLRRRIGLPPALAAIAS